MTVPFMPSSSWMAQMYLKLPGEVNVTRNRVTPGGDWASPARSCGAGDRNPEFTLAEGEAMIAWRAPSESGSTLAEGGRGSAGSVPNVTVWFDRRIETRPLDGVAHPNDDDVVQKPHQGCRL
jgi:hypothetical protein